MTRPRLVLLIRCVTLLALCAFTDFGLYFLASFAWAPLGLMMPVFAAGIACSSCTGDAPTQVQLDIAGVVDGACGGCTDWNGTHILDNTSACTYIDPMHPFTGPGGCTLDTKGLVFTFGGSPFYRVSASAWISISFNHAMGGPYSCLSASTSLTNTGLSDTTNCDASAATISATMIA